LRSKLRNQSFEILLAPLARQPDANQMLVEIRLDFFPPRTGRVADDARAKAAIVEEPRLHDAAQPREIESATKHHDTDDHHQVAWRVHAQPRCVDRRDALAARRTVRHFFFPPEDRTYDSFRSALAHRENRMSDLKGKFEAAVADSKNLPERPDNAT